MNDFFQTITTGVIMGILTGASIFVLNWGVKIALRIIGHE
jgi:hypothetical protein